MTDLTVFLQLWRAEATFKNIAKPTRLLNRNAQKTRIVCYSKNYQPPDREREMLAEEDQR